MTFNTNTNTILYKTLARALSMMRPHNSEGTKRLTDWLETSARTLPNAMIGRDAIGNLHVDTRLNPSNRTLFVAHVDTVHRKEGPNKIRKTATHWHADGAALGADDGAGVAMLMHLLHSGVPAYYVFTQGEECGGIGATWLADNWKDGLAKFDRAIAFDRRGIDSVITHQGRGRCCSDAFGDALSAALNEDMTLMYLPDNSGVYTDTAEFIDIIPECTNISVGYYSEHSDKESIDIIHFQELAKRVARIDWDALPTDRDPTVRESKWGSYYAADYASWGEWNRNGWGATSVSSVDRDGGNTYHHLTDDGDDEWMREELRDALYDAMAGSKQWLIELLCESVYPEDPEMAEHFIDRNKLDEETLTIALQHSTVFDPDTVLAEIFDIAYRT
jgi:hypothetical protein